MMFSQKRVLLLGIGLGVVAIIISMLLKSRPDTFTQTNKARLVDTVALSKSNIAPEIKGFGRTEPEHTWSGVSQVSGRIVYRNPSLASGRFLPANTLLLAIDPTEYKLKVVEAKANKKASEVELTRLNLDEKNLKLSLEIEQNKLTLVKNEVERNKKLNRKNLLSKSALENQQQNYFNQLKLVQDIKNKLTLLPDDRRILEAQLEVEISKLASAERDLQHTEITLPFDARMADVNIENNQFVQLNETMVVAYELGTIQVMAEFSIDDLRVLLSSLPAIPKKGYLPSFKGVDLAASVNLNINNQLLSWPANVERVAQEVDAQSGMIGVYLNIEQDMSQINIADKPPLGKGMFVTAIIKGKTQSQYVVPEKAIQGNQIYVMKANGTLKIIPISVLFRNDDKVAIEGNIQKGDRLIMNDIAPAVNGMALRTSNKVGEKLL
ncbi:HlyD family secretion protein [uncultured Shewanella sp.]|uniref:efflux RND transporter periplasmic adaptor subunit n=1 Tax=uncultured Shewanella sp. TaxID=173975 RepID=UPI00260ADC8E|nr:HlyD family secretion protein [uncultured Shewanella sp.]